MKKVLSIIFVLLMGIVLTGCDLLNNGGTVEIPVSEVDFDDVFLNVSSQIENKDSITADIALPNKFGKVTITWTSENEAIVSSSGAVTRPDEDTRVILKCDLYYDGEHKQYEVILIVKAKDNITPPDLEVSSIKNIKSGEVGQTYKTQGTVVAGFKTGVIIQDNTGMIFCYLGNEKGLELQVGDVIELQGPTSVYGGAVQFTEGSTFEKKSTTTVNPINPDLMTSADFLALATQTVEIKPVKFEGTLVKSGNYYNVTIEGAEANLQGSLCTPKDDLSEFVGKKVEITGYFSYVITSGAGTTYIYVAYTNIKLIDDGGDVPPTPTYSTFADVKANPAGSTYRVKDATVVAIASTGFLAKDSTGYMFVYGGDTYANDLAVGDVAEVAGTSALYGKAYQLSSPTYEKKSTATVAHPNPRTLDGTAFDALNADTISIEYVTVEGTLKVSGSYRNLEVEGANTAGSLLLPAGADVSTLAGKKVSVTGYFVYVSGSTTKYITIMPIEIKESETQPPVVETPVSTIATIIASATGKTYRAQGTVVATSKQSALIKDDTGFVYCYFGSEYAKDLVVGDAIDVEGSTSSYGGLVQFNRPTYKKLGNKEFTPGNPTVLDKDAYEAIFASTALAVQYIQLEGKIAISGNYVNFEVEGSTSQGSIVYPVDDYSALNGKNAKITGYFVGVTGSSTKYFSVIVTNVEEVSGTDVPPTPTPTTITIAEAKALELNTECKVQGTVMALSKESFLIQDATGNILVYVGSGFAQDLALANVVEVSGKIAKYNNALQISNPTYTLGETTDKVEYPNPRALDGAALDALNNGEAPVTEYVEFEGKLTISGKYHNVAVEGATIVGSLVSPIQDMSDLNGKNIKVRGFYLYLNGSSTKYANVLVTNVEEVIGTDTPPTPTPTVISIADAKALETGSECLVQGTVIALSNESFLIEDSSDKILVYAGSSFAKDLVVGNVVEVSGKTALYNKALQISNPTYTIGEATATVDYPTPRILDGAALDALNTGQAPVIEYVQFEGKLTISGKYHNVAVEGATIVGSLVSPAQSLSDLSGKTIKVTGYFLYLNGSSTKYANVLVTNVEEVEGTDTPVEPEVAAISTIKAGEAGVEVAIEGTVVAISTESFLVKDATGLMLAYVGSDYGNDLRAGTLVKVKGTTAMYGGVMQLSTPTYDVKGFDDAFVQPEARVLDLEAYEALNVPYPTPEYVKLQAKLTVSGKYYNLTVGDSILTGSIVSPVENLSNLNDKNIELTGYFVYVSGSSKKYITFMVTDVVEIEADPFAEFKANFAAFSGTKTVSSLSFTTEYEGITISYVSSNLDVMSNDGVVSALPARDTEVTITATMTYGDKTETVTFTIIVKALDTIANLYNKTESELEKERFAVQGTVVATADYGFIIKENDAYVYVYYGNKYAKDLVVGDIATVKGYLGYYNGILEFNNFIGYQKTGTDDSFNPTFTAITTDQMAALTETSVITPVELRATIRLNGNYKNLAIEGTDIVGSITANSTIDLAGYDGRTATVKGYYLYTSTSGETKYFTIMVTSIDIDQLAPEDPFAEFKADFAAFSGTKTVSSISFTTEYEGITLSFVSSNPDVISNDGVVTTLPEQDTEVTFTVTMTNGTITDTCTFTIIVKALDTIANLYNKTQEELDNERFAVQGTVVATAEYGFIIKENDAYVYVYYGNKYAKDLVVGDIATVKGYLGYYNGALEFNEFIGYQKTGTDESFNPTFTAITTDQMAALVEEPVTTPLELHATIRLNGNYKNLEIEGTEIVGSIMTNNDINLAGYDGRTATVKGYYLYTSTSGETKYFNIMVTSIDIDQLAPEVAIAEIKESYASSNGLKTVSSLLFTTEYEGITISFVSSNPDVISNDGVVTTLPEQDTEVTFTVTMTNGTITDTCTFTVIVKALDTIANLYNKTQEELDNERFAVRGTVVATSDVGFLIKQDDAYVYVYYGKNYAKDLVIGDNVIVKGYLGYYNGTLEFNVFIGYAKDGEPSVVTVEYPTADTAFFNNLVENIHITPIETQGLIRMNNQYVNVDLYLTGLAGSLIKNDLDLSGFADKYVKIQGYFVYQAGGFYSIIPTSVEEIEMTYHTITLTYNSEQGEVSFDAEHLEYIPDGDTVVLFALESNPSYVFDYAMVGEERIENKTITLTNVTADMSVSVFFKAIE